ncbi:MAG: hypothetical protein HFJ65_04850 [Eggerthellaceae bacterium]|nr:hypothetical protein [Eggerthellaceae bacterium]
MTTDPIQSRIAFDKPQKVAIGCLVGALMIGTLTGVGTTAIISLLGIMLCTVGLFQRTARIDWWIFAPLAVYEAMNLISSVVTYGSVIYGYGAVQMIFLSFYALTCCLNGPARLMLRKLCVLWAVATAAIGICAFVYTAFFVNVTRLAFVVGAPNGLGIFLVLGWFALMSCKLEEGEGAGSASESLLTRILSRSEPVILVALTLTLSMGSFTALVIGIIVMLLGQKRGRTWGDVWHFACIVLSKAVVCLVVGFLTYLAAERAQAPILSVVLVLYLICLTIIWPRFQSFLESRQLVSVILTFAGAFCVLLALVMRPSSLATFAERVHMMANGIGYLGDNPLTGVGPLQWRMLNLQDADTYFNTYQIHNLFIHVGVELGLIAMVALIVIAVRLFIKRYKQAQHGEDAAFLFHVLTDTGFFYVGVTGMFILTAGGSETEVKPLPKAASKVLFAMLGLAHVAILGAYLMSFM